MALLTLGLVILLCIMCVCHLCGVCVCVWSLVCVCALQGASSIPGFYPRMPIAAPTHCDNREMSQDAAPCPLGAKLFPTPCGEPQPPRTSPFCLLKALPPAWPPGQGLEVGGGRRRGPKAGGEGQAPGGRREEISRRVPSF